MTEVLGVVDDERKRLNRLNKVVTMKMEKYEQVRVKLDDDNSILLTNSLHEASHYQQKFLVQPNKGAPPKDAKSQESPQRQKVDKIIKNHEVLSQISRIDKKHLNFDSCDEIAMPSKHKMHNFSFDQ